MNPWLAHLKSFCAKNKTKMSYRQAMSAAKKTYTPKSKNGKSKNGNEDKPKRRRKKKKT